MLTVFQFTPAGKLAEFQCPFCLATLPAKNITGVCNGCQVEMRIEVSVVTSNQDRRVDRITVLPLETAFVPTDEGE